MTTTEPSQLQLRLRVLLISLSFSVLIAGIKWWAYFISHSVALKTDALESFINIVAILMALFAVYHSQRPADWNHPYGHGKIEFFSSAVEGGMLLFGSCYLLYESIQSLFNPQQLSSFQAAFILSTAAGILNGLLGYWQLRKGQMLKSEAIVADATHLLADFFTTLGILVGLVLVSLTQLYFLDAVMGIVVSLWLLRNALIIIKKSALILSDIEDPALITKLVALLNSPLKDSNIVDVHRVRSFRSGTRSFIDLHVVVPEFWNVRQAHDETETFCANLRENLEQDSEFHPHVEACMRKYCAQCEVRDCPIRMKPFQERTLYSSSHIVAASEEDE